MFKDMSSSISERRRKYKLCFYNPITTETEYIRSYDTEEETVKEANKIDVNFYSKYPRLLPKGVYIVNNQFCLAVKGKLVSSNKKNILVGSAKTLKDIKEIKLNVIKCLFD